jgi:hypothetical protein
MELLSLTVRNDQMQQINAASLAARADAERVTDQWLNASK